MTPRAKTQSASPSRGPDAKRNFILQQGLCEPAAGTCPILYSALLFQPRLVGLWVVVAAILQSPLLFYALAAVLCWSALAPPRLNPFDALYDWTLARPGGITLASAPAPRRFTQFLSCSFARAIGISLTLGWRMAALVLEAFFIVAIGALVFGGVLLFCLSSLPWTRRLCQAHSAVGYRRLTCAD